MRRPGRRRWRLATVIDRAAATPPADGSKPRARRHHRGRPCGWRLPRRPAIEPPPRAARVDSGRGAQVLAEIQEHVDKSQADFARRSQGMGVITLGPDGATTFESAIDGARTPDAEPLQTAREIAAAIGFDDEVQMVRLDREVNDSEGVTTRRGKRPKQMWGHFFRTKRDRRRNSTKCGVNGIAWVVIGSRSVRCTRPRACWLPSGARPPAAPCRGDG